MGLLRIISWAFKSIKGDIVIIEFTWGEKHLFSTRIIKK